MKRKAKKTVKKPAGRASRLRRNILQSLDLPVETDPKITKLSMICVSDLLIENHCGILQCAQKQIIISTCEHKINITGENLMLKELALSRAYISGKIEAIAFAE